MGLVPYFVEALKADDCPILQLEAAWALTNVSAGTCDDTKVVIENGALPLLVEFTTKQSVDLKEQALWAIGNIAAEKSFLKALVEKGALEHVLCVLENERESLRLTRISIWALANFCRYGTDAIRISSDYIPRIASMLATLLKHVDRQVLNDAAWAVASFTGSEWASQTKEFLVQNGVLRILAKIIISSDRPTTHYPALKSCAQILAGPESYAAEFLSVDGILQKLKKLLTSKTNRKTMSNILWLLQNIVANKFRTCSQIFSSGIIPRLIELIVYGPYEIRTEAGSVLNNMFYISDLPLKGLDILVGQDAVRALCAMLTWENKKAVTDALNALDKVLNESGKNSAQKYYHLSNIDETYCIDVRLKKEKKRVRVHHQGSNLKRHNAIAQRVINAGGKHTLLLLADNEDRTIKQISISILGQYFEMREFYLPYSSDEDSDPVEMFDENGDQLDDSSSDLSVGAKDEMALCDDITACKIWEAANGCGSLE